MEGEGNDDGGRRARLMLVPGLMYLCVCFVTATLSQRCLLISESRNRVTLFKRTNENNGHTYRNQLTLAEYFGVVKIENKIHKKKSCAE